MSSEAERLKSQVQRELELIPSPHRRRALEKMLYGPIPSDRDGLDCWVVAYDGIGLELIYSEHGPDPEARWAFRPTAAPGPAPGAWTWYLEEAFIRSGAWQAPVILFDQARFHVPPSERWGDEWRDGIYGDR